MTTRGLDETEVNSTFGSSILRKESFFVFDFSVELISNQLTLIEWVDLIFEFVYSNNSNYLNSF